MADRYWRGGTATWNTTNTTSWSTTSGGAGGASVPTSSDDVFFDAGSDTGANFTVTLGSSIVCRSMIVSGHDRTITFTGTGALTIHRDLNWIPVGTNIVSSAFTGDFIFAGAAAIEQFISFSDIVCGADLLFLGTTTTTYTFTSDFNGNSNSSIELRDGTLNTNNCTITVSFWTTQTGTSTTNFSASLIVITGIGGLVYGAGRTVNAGTSLIRFTNTGGSTTTITMPNYTLHNIAFTATTRGVFAINSSAGGNLTCNNFSVTAPTNGRKWIALGGVQPSEFMTLTINGTFTVSGTDPRFATQFVNNVSNFNSPCTINAAATDLNYVSFLGISGAGAAAPFTGTAIGNIGNCSGITFTTPKTVYYRGAAGTHNWITAANTFGTTSGDAGANANFPLPQDTVIVDNNTLASTIRGGVGGDREIQFGSLDASTRTTAITIAPDSNFRACGESGILSTPAAVTWTQASNTFIIHSALDLDVTNSFNQIILLRGRKQASPNYHTIRLVRNFTHNPNFPISNQGGYFDLNGFTLVAYRYNCYGGSSDAAQLPRGLVIGSGTFNLTYTASQIPALDCIYNNGHVFDESYINVVGGTGTQTITLHGGDTAGQTFAPSIKFLGSFSFYDLIYPYWNNLDASGGSGTLDLVARSIYGDVVVGAGTPCVANANSNTFIGSKNQTIDMGGQNMRCPLIINKTAGTKVTLLSNLTITDSYSFTLTQGELDLGSYTLTTTLFSSSNSNVRKLIFGTGVIVCQGTGTTWSTGTATNLTITNQATGRIKFTNASAKSLSGGGASLPTIDLAGAGLLTVSGSNNFYDLVNTVSPAGISFPQSTTTTFDNFNLRGTAGNLIIVKSTNPLFRADLSKSSGIVDCDYLTINDTDATGGATWYAGSNSVDGTDNSGWIFTAAPAAVVGGNFFMMFNWDFPNP